MLSILLLNVVINNLLDLSGVLLVELHAILEVAKVCPFNHYAAVILVVQIIPLDRLQHILERPQFHKRYLLDDARLQDVGARVGDNLELDKGGVSTFEQVLHKQVIACDRKIEQLDNVRRATIHAVDVRPAAAAKVGVQRAATQKSAPVLLVLFNWHRYRRNVDVVICPGATERYTLVRAN